MNNLQNLFSNTFLLIGIFFWLWGSIPLLNKKNSIFYKLHTLTVSDTVGSVIIILGLIIRQPDYWPVLIVSVFTLTLWNTISGYLLGSLADKK